MDMYHTGAMCPHHKIWGVANAQRMGKDDRRGRTNRPSGRSRGRVMCRLSKKHKMAPSPQSFDRSIITNGSFARAFVATRGSPSSRGRVGLWRAIQKPEITLFHPTCRLHQSAHTVPNPFATNQPTNQSFPVQPSGVQEPTRLPSFFLFFFFMFYFFTR